jgi:hypothetical protein
LTWKEIAMRRLLWSLGTTVLFLPLAAAPVSAGTTVDSNDDQLTGEGVVWVRHDGGTDAAIRHCNDDATSPTPDQNAGDNDLDSNDGGSRRQNNEPFSVVDPTDTDVVVSGWNDYCLTDFDAGWQGIGYSLDAGETWTNSFVPGYPLDTSREGRRSPIFGNRFAGDPIGAFDNDGNLYVGGISFNRTGATNGHVYVATYAADDMPNGYPVDYRRTRIVGRGTPSRNFQGVFQDKPMLETDRTEGAFDGNVYVCWSRFTGFGQNKIYFSRSTDMGRTFSEPRPISRSNTVIGVQGCDISVESDGDVYVTYRTFATGSKPNGLAFNRSTDGGVTFSRARLIRSITPYNPFDGDRDCGDGDELCPSEFVFARVPLEPRSTADPTGQLPGVFLTFNEIRPGTVTESATTYSSAGAGLVGQSLVYVVRTVDNGRTWSAPFAVDAVANGHQFFSDIDAEAGLLSAVWQDSRTDPCYSVQRPVGNTRNATSCGTDIVNTFVAASANGTSFAPSVKVSDAGHQFEYEMFGDRQVPFQGDYNWIDLVRMASGRLFGYFTWTDNRDVVEGTDTREPGQDGFDVEQCRTRTAGEFGDDTCPNAGGLDQNIYGNSLTAG